MDKNVSLLEQIENKSLEDYKPVTGKFKKALKQMFEVDHKNNTQPRPVWLMENALKHFHKQMGDEQFYNMLNTNCITTDSKGWDYANEFLNQYEE